MILSKLASLSWPRLLHVALSCLCVLAIVLGLASGALAASGDPSGHFYDFPYIGYQYSVRSTGPSDGYIRTGVYTSTSNITMSRATVFLPFDLISGSVITDPVLDLSSSSSGFVDNFVSFNGWTIGAYDSSGTRLAVKGISDSLPWAIPSGTRFLLLNFRSNMSSSVTFNMYASFAGMEYSNFVYDYGSASSSDIMDGLTAIAQSLLDLETGPYYGVSGVTVDQNGDLQHTLTQNASLEDLLNALGIAGTDTNHVIRGIYNNFGSYFTLYSLDDSTSSTTQVYRGLPQYVNALGQSVTDGINRLQRDHDLLYQQTADLSDALYADTNSNPSESWSVAEWLRGIFNSINSFFTSFWSPAETDLKFAAEEGMQEAADRGIAGSGDQVGDMDDLGSGFASFGSTGNIGSGDLLNSLTSGDYSFFSQTTQDNLSVHPPASQSRVLRSAPQDPDQVEYVDELSRNRDLLQEVLGLP